MAATSRKSSNDKFGKLDCPRPQSASKPKGGSRDARRVKQARRASALLRLVSDPTRLGVILLLAEGERDVGTLCRLLRRGQPAVSHQLALLRHGGAITPRREGAKNFYALTDAGCALAGVVQILLDRVATERSAVRPRPARTSSPLVPLTRPGREESSDATGASAIRSEGRAGAEEESWSRMNRRRAELIFKKNRRHLNDGERSELERLQALSRSRMQLAFPGPTLIDERLERIEEHLCSDGAEEA